MAGFCSVFVFHITVAFESPRRFYFLLFEILYSWFWPDLKTYHIPACLVCLLPSSFGTLSQTPSIHTKRTLFFLPLEFYYAAENASPLLKKEKEY